MTFTEAMERGRALSRWIVPLNPKGRGLSCRFERLDSGDDVLTWHWSENRWAKRERSLKAMPALADILLGDWGLGEVFVSDKSGFIAHNSECVSHKGGLSLTDLEFA